MEWRSCSWWKCNHLFKDKVSCVSSCGHVSRPSDLAVKDVQKPLCKLCQKRQTTYGRRSKSYNGKVVSQPYGVVLVNGDSCALANSILKDWNNKRVWITIEEM